MEIVVTLIISLLVGIALGGLVGWLLAKRATPIVEAGEDPQLVEARHQAEIMALRADEAAARAALEASHLERRSTEAMEAAGVHSRLQSEISGLTARLEGLQGEVVSREQRYRELVARHQAEANAQKQRDLAESQVLQALTPVQESLRTMQAKVHEIETQRSLQHGELAQQLRTAAESEERLRSTAESLASALRSNSTRGVWGETQLRSVVESAGLLHRVDFDVQASITSDSGHGRPDMVVHLPGGKNIAVDAKVPFNSYLEAAAIGADASEAELARKAVLMKAHVKAVRDHITALGSKTYWDGLDASPEMVIAFIPSESLVSSALEADPSIMEFAFSRRVALSSPVTLWSVLKTVAFSWQQDVVTQEAKQLFDLSRELYSRLATMGNHVAKMGRSIESSVKAYNSFVGSLERQVLPSARKLNALDESKVLPTLDGIEEAPRELTAFELTTVEHELDAVAPHQPELIDLGAVLPGVARDSKTA
ncbi:DNA recombination protein RmuC [Amnibacterium flavum]|uniref:DNA recombination protein RmuC n=1 Tax=Amnibacterium flavum TaxID=2173173 RepID=A0A2V1HTU4_9MICO|nr:DNA recombination protein RmuC [Amnibacterium flavum]PVZ93727.1 DNA recombination protein RmuC [Amnibacterium flavum]